jgi:hypothetical protein
MREENAPGIAEPLMEMDRAFGGFGLEVGGDIAKLKCHVLTPQCFKGDG